MLSIRNMIDWFFPIFFLVSATIALVTSGPVAEAGIVGIFVAEAWFVFSFFRFVFREKAIRNLVLLSFIYALGIYAVLFSKINNFELWVDEIAVINIAQLPLGNVARAAMTMHVAVPPLDYWNLWLWQHAVQLFPSSVREFTYRIPYMTMHTTAAVMFGLLVWSLLKKEARHWSIYLASFLAYFFHPILFLYSFEVRYYALMLLGVVVCWYMYVRQKNDRLGTVPLLWIFLLNSVFHMLFLLPFVLLEFFNRTKRISFYVFVGGYLWLTWLIVPRLYYPSPDPAVRMVDRMHLALAQFLALQINYWWQTAALIFLCCLVAIQVKRHRFISEVIWMLTVGFFIVEALNMRLNYRYFSFKQYIVFIPLLLVLFFSLLATVSSKMRKILLLVFTLIFVVPWSYGTIRTVTQGSLFSKDLIGAKDLFVLAQRTGKDAVYVIGSPQQREARAYNRISLDWYASLSPSVRLVADLPREKACVQASLSKTAMLYVLAGNTPCDQFMDRTQVVFPQATVFY